jgi:hypothetical protein
MKVVREQHSRLGIESNKTLKKRGKIFFPLHPIQGHALAIVTNSLQQSSFTKAEGSFSCPQVTVTDPCPCPYSEGN